MTGMKEGAGEDPFADDDVSTEGGERDESTSQSGSGPKNSDRSGSGPSGTDSTRTPQSQIQIPYKFRRDGVQDGRDRVPLFLHSETKSGERDALRELEDRFDADVSLTDLREALVMVGLDHLDEVERQLEEWGYGMTFDE